MEYGICGTPELAAVAADAGFDFLEMSVDRLLRPREDEAAFRDALAEAAAAPLPRKVLNGFVPGDLKITGPEADLAALKTYVTTCCRRAREAGVEVIVFGSGGARQIPDGFDRAEARRQLVAFCRMLGPVAQAHGVTIAVEPLSRADCNVLTTVGEAAELVRETAHPAIRLLVDAYHWARDNDSAEDVVANGPLLAHVHIATVPNRLCPGAEDCDLAPFFTALTDGGYNGRVSVEARMPSPADELPRALSVMKVLGGDPAEKSGSRAE